MGSISISQDLIGHCRLVLDQALRYALSGKGIRQGTNAYAPYALPAYITAVASVEAFISESLLSQMSLATFRSSPLAKMGIDWLDKVDLRQKVSVVPELLFNWSFDTSAQPYQDFCLLVKTRNDLTHYAFSKNNPPYARTLKERGIFLMHAIEKQEKFQNPWAQDASCTEGIRWAHNVACDVVNNIIDNAPEKSHIDWNRDNFNRIPDTYISSFLKGNGIDPNANNPPTV